MPRGGRRPGSGRKKGDGLPEKKNRLPIIADAREHARLRKRILDLQPLDVMVKTMNGFVSAAEILGKDIVRVDEKIITQLRLLKEASEIAKDCAPYIHAKPAAKLEHTGADGEPIEHRIVAEIVSGGAVTRE